MRGFLLVMLFACWLSCSPTYESGKTRCSETGECPSGFICSDNGSGSPDTCLTRPSFCPDQDSFYCPSSSTCWTKAVACSTVLNCGTSASPDYLACANTGYYPDCNGTTCLPNSSRTDGGTGGAGAGGSTGTDVRPDLGAPDARTPDGQACPPPAAGGTCNVFPSCGCPAGRVCYPNTQATGLTCVTTAGLGEGAACNGKGCADGFGCFGGVCKVYCQSDSDCPAVDSVRACHSTYWDSDNTIAGVSVCTRVCDPVSQPTAGLSRRIRMYLDEHGSLRLRITVGDRSDRLDLFHRRRLHARVLLQCRQRLHKVLLHGCRLPDGHGVHFLLDPGIRWHHPSQPLLLPVRED